VPQTSRPVAYIPVSSDFMSYSAVCFFFLFFVLPWLWSMNVYNKKCDRRVRPTRYAPAGRQWQRYSIGPRRLRLITWPCDLDLWSWRSWRLWLMRVVVLHPYTKFEVRIGLAVRKTMCVSISCPGDFDLWPFDLQTGMRVRVASKVGNLPWAR